MAALAAVDEAALAAVRGLMRQARVPGHFDKVYKEECMFCFASNESPGGLFINLSTHQAFDAEHLPLDQQRGSDLYLHQQARKVSQRASRPQAVGAASRPVQAVADCSCKLAILPARQGWLAVRLTAGSTQPSRPTAHTLNTLLPLNQHPSGHRLLFCPRPGAPERR
jgi:hypothetical protein